jgi:cytochrome b6-f complex iron-sulfur subunit
MNRRDVIQRVLLGGAVLIVAPSVLDSCSKDPSTNPGGGGPGPGNNIELDLTQAANSALNNAGGWIIVQNIIIINTGGGNFSALSSICTHQGCTVGFNPGTGNIQCPCHGSVYTTAGTVVSGPAPRALTSYTALLAGNTLTVKVV